MASRMYYTPNGPIMAAPSPQELAVEAANLVASPVFQALLATLAPLVGKTVAQLSASLTTAYISPKAV